METALLDWANLVVRWTHVIVGIAWIGTSFLFMWLDAHLENPEPGKKGVEGELWMVHSGGFYEVNKYLVAPAAIPRTLHWFKWEAGFTGITGVMLLVIIYYLGAESYLVEAGSGSISRLQAVGIGITTLVAGWFAYDALFASRASADNPLFANVLSILALVTVAIVLTQIFTGRAAYMHVGALIGIVMVINVFVRIIPAQRKLIAARLAGEEPDPRLGRQAKQRSVHNNYLTLPVVFIMISSHYPMTFGHSLNWLFLIAISLSGALVRHWFNLRNAGSPQAWPLAAAVFPFVGVAIIASWPAFERGAGEPAAERIAFSEIRQIINERCLSCHAAEPRHENFDAAPKDVRFNTAAEILSHVEAIRITTVETDTMPLGNETGMTPDERQRLGLWIRHGAPAP